MISTTNLSMHGCLRSCFLSPWISPLIVWQPILPPSQAKFLPDSLCIHTNSTYYLATNETTHHDTNSDPYVLGYATLYSFSYDFADTGSHHGISVPSCRSTGSDAATHPACTVSSHSKMAANDADVAGMFGYAGHRTEPDLKGVPPFQSLVCGNRSSIQKIIR